MAEDEYRQNIIKYFKKNISKGYTPEALKWGLISQGYSRIIVENAFEEANKELAKKAPILEEKPRIRHEIIGENDQAIVIKKPWWKRIFS